MTRFDATTAECRVFTFKEGALSAIAHDLELAVGTASIEVGEDLAIEARIGLAGLRVLHAVKDGHATSALSDGDKRKIERTIAEDVLDTRRHAEALFRGKAEPVGGSYRISGELTLHGKTRPLTVAGQARDGRQVFEVSLHQPDFGIKPYSAMLGTLKVKADVKVRIAVPWPAS